MEAEIVGNIAAQEMSEMKTAMAASFVKLARHKGKQFKHQSVDFEANSRNSKCEKDLLINTDVTRISRIDCHLKERMRLIKVEHS